MIRLLLAILALLGSLSPGGAAERPKVPDDLLRTTDRAWNLILASEVSEDFRATPLRHVLEYLVLRSNANVRVVFGDQKPAAITRTFERVPFRTVMFLLAKDSGATVSWDLDPQGFQRGIVFATK